MKIAIGADHGGVDLKAEVVAYLKENNYNYEDLGTYGHASVDYPDVALKVAEYVKDKKADKGIVICGTGIGVSISANKVPGIRCALLSDVYSAQMTREHNDANMMAMGGRVVGPGLAVLIVETFLKTEFSHGERHQRRVDKIQEIETKFRSEGK